MNLPSTEILLSDWGIQKVSEIGFASVGVQDFKTHQKLLIYDLRKAKPARVAVPSDKKWDFFSQKRGRVEVKHLAFWLWETEKILKNPGAFQNLLLFVEKEKVTDLFVQIPYQVGKKTEQNQIHWDSSLFVPFISALHQRGVKVHALDGNPQFVLRPYHPQMLSLVQEIIQFNQKVPLESRFAGIHWDHEPYLLPAFNGVHKQEVLQQYLELLEKTYPLCAQHQLEFGVDIPFWLDRQNEFGESLASLKGKSLDQWIIENVDNVGLMDYRTETAGPDGVVAHALPVLKYASQWHKKVFVGLETSMTPNEFLFEFLPGEKEEGEVLWIEALPNEKARVSLITRQNLPKMKSKLQSGLVLFQNKQIEVPSSRLSFAEKTPEDLEEVMRESAKYLAEYSSFYGFAIHSFESYNEQFNKK